MCESLSVSADFASLAPRRGVIANPRTQRAAHNDWTDPALSLGNLPGLTCIVRCPASKFAPIDHPAEPIVAIYQELRVVRQQLQSPVHEFDSHRRLPASDVERHLSEVVSMVYAFVHE